MPRSSAYFCSLLCLFLLAACVSPVQNPGADLRTLPEKGEEPANLVPSSPLISAGGARHTAILGGPACRRARRRHRSVRRRRPLSGAPASLTIEQMPLPAFINTVFGDTLHLTFEIDPRIAQRTDLVTLRTGRPLPPSRNSRPHARGVA